MKKIIVALVLCLLAFCSQAEDKIESAFGLKLGAVFDINSASGTEQTKAGEPMYQFAATNTFRSFKRYYVLITPTTHKIYCIWGLGPADTLEKSESERDLIIDILKKKYGSPEGDKLFDTTGSKQINQGNRYIIVSSGNPFDIRLQIQYFDGDLRKLADSERMEMEKKKVDASGL